MNAPIYEDDLTTIHRRHAMPLLHLCDRAQSTSAALGAAEHENELAAVLAVLNRIAKVVRGLFAKGEVWQPDQPFADFDFGLGSMSAFLQALHLFAWLILRHHSPCEL